MIMFQNSVLKSFTQNESLDLKSQINQTDKEIDAIITNRYLYVSVIEKLLN